MKVGITYDLREDYLAQGYGEEETAEFDRLDTIEAIEGTLTDLGFQAARIGNIWALAPRLVAGERWDLVFNIAEGLRGFAREAQVPSLLDAYDIPYTFSDPMILALTLHKGMTKRVVRDLGLATPDFAVVEDESEIETVNLPYPLFAKPVAEGTGKGIDAASKVADGEELAQVCRRLLAQFQQPVLLEAYLPGREFTVGITGTGREAVSIGVMEVLLLDQAERAGYSYANKKNYEDVVTYRLVDDEAARQAEEVALAAWRGLGGRDGGRIDLRADTEGTPHFLEVNPLPGLHPIHSDLPILARLRGMSYRELIGRIMASALNRLPEGRRVVAAAG
ncbi:MAG TPA: D-alanine--D-alanine ligase [Syntrophobacteria bacterium]|nr:D-alanine--D-alanine ligase [Syntrophobacteria bacterium]